MVWSGWEMATHPSLPLLTSQPIIILPAYWLTQNRAIILKLIGKLLNIKLRHQASQSIVEREPNIAKLLQLWRQLAHTSIEREKVI